MTQQAQTIQGSIVAIVTPMFEDGSVDWKGLEKLVEWHIGRGHQQYCCCWNDRRRSPTAHREAETAKAHRG